MTARRTLCPDCNGPKDEGRGHKWCQSCRNIRRLNRAHRARGHRGRELRRRYGISIAEYDMQSDAQGNRCAICQADPIARPGRILHFSVDHDHANGEFRGLLCQRCNMALHFLENTEWRDAAEAYLSRPPVRDCGPLLADTA